MKKLMSFFIVFLLLTQACFASELVVYSSRNASYLKPLFDDYSRQTGTSVSYLVAEPAALIAKMQVEGEQGQADLLLVTGVDNLEAAANKGLLTKVSSKTLLTTIPVYFRSADNQWFAISKRARTIIYNSEKVSRTELQGYQDLENPKWKQRLCLTTSASDYNQSLIALLLARLGEEATLKMLKGWVSNLSTSPLSDDMSLIELMNSGTCDIGIVNSYYYARLLHKVSKTPLKLYWADQHEAGVSMNITGAAVTANAANKSQAVDLLEWLTTKRPQALYAKLSMEYPANPKVNPARLVGKWGKFKEDTQTVSNASRYRDKAIELIKQAGYK